MAAEDKGDTLPPKVRLLLDVDGVLNAVCKKPDRSVWPDWKQAECNGWAIRYSPSMGARLLALAQLPGVELRWLTTWEHDANVWIGPLFDWPTFQVIERHDLQEQASGLVVATKTWWKLDEAKALYEADQVPFVWMDDDLGGFYDDGAAKWVESLNGRALGIRPDGRLGLTNKLLRKVEEHVEWALSRPDEPTQYDRTSDPQ